MTNDSAAFHAVALVAAARTALQTARRIGDRRVGRDASAQEPERTVRDDLGGLHAEVGAMLVRLRLRVVAGVPEGEAAALAQAFEDRLLLDDLGDALGTAHQKLLSLYPAVPEAVVEDARVLAGEARRRSLADDYGRALAAFTARVGDFRDALAEVLTGGD